MTTQQNSPFSIYKSDVVLVKPAKTIPSQLLSLSTMDNNPHLELHCHIIYVYEANPHAKTDPIFILKEALSKVLVDYYPLAGKIKRFKDGKLQITCDPDDVEMGVPFLEATTDSDLSALNHFENIDAEIIRPFFFEYSPSQGKDHNGYYHPLVMQVTKFSCGGFTVALGLLHAVSDGFATVQFCQALGEFASGVTELSVKPVWERERLVGSALGEDPIIFPEDNPPLVTSPFLPSNDMVHAWFNIEAKSINKLRTLSLPKENGENHVVDPPLTSLEILGSYIWRARFKALNQNLDGKTVCMLIMGAKHLIFPPLPQGYYGNAIVATHVGLTGKDLVEWPLNEVAKVIKHCKKIGSSVEYVKGSIDFLETMVQQKVEPPLGNATMVFTDCRQLGWCEMADFGWNKPVNMIALPWSMTGHIDSCVMLTPYYRKGGAEKGGARVVISLPREAMGKYKEEIDVLLKGGDEK